MSAERLAPFVENEFGRRKGKLDSEMLLQSGAEEMLNIASRLKRQDLITNGKIGLVRDGAENYFRTQLQSVSEPLYQLYLHLKSGDIAPQIATQGWRQIAEVVDEIEIKEGYINSFLGIKPDMDQNYIESALRIVIEKRLKQRREILSKRFSRLNLPHSEESVDFVLDIESRANEILYDSQLVDSIFASSDKPNKNLNLLYYLCLRFKHQGGFLDIATDLQPFSYIDLHGDIQKRSGASKLFQLDTVKELTHSSGHLTNIKHIVIVMDSDIMKFGDEGVNFATKTGEYVNSVRAYLPSNIQVVSEVDFYNQMDLEGEFYQEVYESVQRNDGRYAPILDVENNRRSDRAKMNRTLKDWTDERSNVYTSHAIARNILEGHCLANNTSECVSIVFNDRIKIGEQFNYLSAKKLPFVALPIQANNIGGIEYA